MTSLKGLLALLFFAFVAVSLLQAAKPEVEDGVLVLTEDNFEETVKDADIILVEFYAPWCGHCKKLTPEYAKAAAVLKDNDPPIPLAKVDATVERGLAEEFGIKGFPTLKVFKKGVASEYEGGRTEKTIVSYMLKKVGPPAKSLDSVEAAENFISSKDAVIVGFFSSAESAPAKLFLQMADANDDFAFGITTDEAVRSKYEISGDVISVFKTYDEPRTDFSVSDLTESSDLAGLSNDIIGATTYLIETFSDERAKNIFGGKVQVHALVFADPDSEEFGAAEQDLRSAATHLKGKVLFVNIPTSQKRVYDYFGVKTSDVPKFAISDMRSEGSNKKYYFDGAMTSGALKSFAEDVLAGKIAPNLKSEEPEAADLEAPVKVVKGKSFNQIVVENNKDVLVEFYAPWCGHCKSLAPIYDSLGEELEGIDSVVIAKMDATANEIDHPKINVKGFPTLYFFPGNAKDSPVLYSGARTLEGFKAFLEENVATPFEKSAKKEAVKEEL